MKSDLTGITLVLDRSGSMEEIRTDAEGGVNTFKKVGRMRTQRRTGQAVSNEFTEEERKEME